MNRRVPVFFYVACTLTAVSANAQTTPRMVRVSYANQDAARHMGITWHSESNALQSVKFGVASVDEREVTSVVTPSPLGGGLDYVHSATLDNLSPATTYQYRLGNPTDGWAPSAGAFTFATGPSDPCEPFRFVALGDTRGEAELEGILETTTRWPSIFENIDAENADFALVAGDLVEDGDSLDEWNEFFNQGVDIYPRFPVMPAFGNHDKNGDGVSLQNYELLYTLPRNDQDRETFYYFRYANALFIAFNSQYKGPTSDYAEQRLWLENVLENNPATWKVIFFHHPVWTLTPGETALGCFVCGHEPNEKGQNEMLIDLIDRYDIDIVVQSHNHHYERSVPLQRKDDDAEWLQEAQAARGTEVGTRNAEGVVPTWGSVYLVTGGGGATLAPITLAGNLQLKPVGHTSWSDKYHYVRFDVSNLTLQADVVHGIDGDILDTFTLTKLGQYQVGACGPQGPPDLDGDGYDTSVDCNDDLDTVYPGAEETCGDGIDQDCSGADLACPPVDGGPGGGDSVTGGDVGGDGGSDGGGGGASGCACRQSDMSTPLLGVGLVLVVLTRRRTQDRSS